MKIVRRGVGWICWGRVVPGGAGRHCWLSLVPLTRPLTSSHISHLPRLSSQPWLVWQILIFQFLACKFGDPSIFSTFSTPASQVKPGVGGRETPQVSLARESSVARRFSPPIHKEHNTPLVRLYHTTIVVQHTSMKYLFRTHITW